MSLQRRYNIWYNPYFFVFVFEFQVQFKTYLILFILNWSLYSCPYSILGFWDRIGPNILYEHFLGSALFFGRKSFRLLTFHIFTSLYIHINYTCEQKMDILVDLLFGFSIILVKKKRSLEKKGFFWRAGVANISKRIFLEPRDEARAEKRKMYKESNWW